MSSSGGVLLGSGGLATAGDRMAMWRNREKVGTYKPRKVSGGPSPPQHINCKTSSLQNCRQLNFCCLSPLSLWHFVLAAQANKYTQVLLQLGSGWCRLCWSHAFERDLEGGSEKAIFLLLGLFLIANQVVGNLLLAEVLGTPVCSHLVAWC